ncbi:MAG TPA: SDR family oxidoreductase [Solirubrobacteraceae bacterium]|jgi:3-oxoacyl-[acyl-carrier protein] reductase
MGELSTKKTVLVTGGTRGIGKAIAYALGQEGAVIAVNYLRDRRSADAMVTEAASAGIHCVAFPADVSTAGGAAYLVAAVEDQIGPIDVLVNNVGEFALGELGTTSPGAWDKTIASNLSSIFYVSRHALPSMRARRNGCIVNVGLAPAYAIRAAPNIAPYAIAKAGVGILTKSLASEEARCGIRVNCVAPGLVDSGHLSAQELDWMLKRLPLGRVGRPEEVAAAVAFLASERASYISGATLAVSGGWDWEDRATRYDHSELFQTA